MSPMETSTELKSDELQRNSFHLSFITKDPYKHIPHLTVRLSNSEMRSKFEFTTLHWRRDGLSFWLEIDYEEQAKFISREETPDDDHHHHRT